jgi:hypothetical protein
MPCNQNILSRFFGSGSSTGDNGWSGSSCKKDSWCEKKCGQIGDYVVYPHRERHELVKNTCGVHRIPFFNLSSVFFDTVVRVTPDNKTPVIYNVDEFTLFPTGNTCLLYTSDAADDM